MPEDEPSLLSHPNGCDIAGVDPKDRRVECRRRPKPPDHENKSTRRVPLAPVLSEDVVPEIRLARPYSENRQDQSRPIRRPPRPRQCTPSDEDERLRGPA